MRIYLTHCTDKKDDELKNTHLKVTPDKLYIAIPTQRFIHKCKEKKTDWAIFSDEHGVWFPNIEHEWYNKHPDNVTKTEFRNLLYNFDQKLEQFDEIWFYHNPGRFHPLYKALLQETKLSVRVTKFTHLDEIA